MGEIKDCAVRLFSVATELRLRELPFAANQLKDGEVNDGHNLMEASVLTGFIRVIPVRHVLFLNKYHNTSIKINNIVI